MAVSRISNNFAAKGASMNNSNVKFNEAQLKVLEMMSFVNTPEAWRDLQIAISDYFANNAQKEMEKLWGSGKLSSEKIDSFRNLHERTPYRKAHI